MNKEIGPLTGLRGVAALWVFLWHSVSISDQYIDLTSAVLLKMGGAGYLGVDVFFTLSGFILAYNYAGEDLLHQPRGYLRFLWKRLARIYPVHVATILLLAVLFAAFWAVGDEFIAPSRLTLESLLRNLTLTQAWSIPVTKSWNTVSWSISCEWAAYLVFPCIAAFSLRLRSQIVVVAVIGLLFVLLANILHTGVYTGTLPYGIARVATEFSAGVLLYRLWQLRQFEHSSAAGWVALCALATLIVGGNSIAINISRYAAMLYLPATTCVIVYGLAASKGIVQRALSHRVALLAGRISFSFYMVHLLVIVFCRHILNHFSSAEHQGHRIIMLATALIVAGLVAAWMYKVVEEPARRWMLAPRKSRIAMDGTEAQGRL